MARQTLELPAVRRAQGLLAGLPGASVVRAAVMYFLRPMIDDPIPMNEGCLAPVTIRVPAGSMLSPRYPAAVVAGNVETSQAVTDALFGAFGAMAASQGTMNNFTFGNDRYQYYETIAGGSGAGPGSVEPGVSRESTRVSGWMPCQILQELRTTGRRWSWTPRSTRWPSAAPAI